MKTALVFGMAAGLVFSLAACDPFTSPLPGAFDDLNQEITALELSDLGQPVGEQRSGGGLAGTAPTYTVVLEGADADEVGSRLTEAGYAQAGGDGNDAVWTKEADLGQFDATTSALPAGTDVSDGAGGTREVTEPGISVSIRLTPSGAG